MNRTVTVELTQHERTALVLRLGGRRSWAAFEYGAADVALLRSDRDSAIRKITEARPGRNADA